MVVVLNWPCTTRHGMDTDGNSTIADTGILDAVCKLTVGCLNHRGVKDSLKWLAWRGLPRPACFGTGMANSHIV